MTWQDFMFAAIGVAVLSVSGGLLYTFTKLWRILDHFDTVSERVEETSQLLRIPTQLIGSLSKSKKGGEKRHA